MDSSAIVRSAVSAGVLCGIAWAMTGGAVSTTDLAYLGGVQAAASYGSDQVHTMLMMWPTSVTGAVVTGALYTGAQRLLRNEVDYVTNYAFSAGSDFAARRIDDMLLQKKNYDEAAGAEDAMDEEY